MSLRRLLFSHRACRRVAIDVKSHVSLRRLFLVTVLMQYSLSELGIEQMLGAGLESYRAWRRDYNAMCTIVIQCSRRVAIDVGVMCPSEGFFFTMSAGG